MKKIFVAVGTHPQQFDRLLKEVDRIAGSGKLKAEIFAQTGKSEYRPKNFKSKQFLPIGEFDLELKKADFVVTHAGEGNIGLCKNLGKKFVAVPRRKEFEEHTNDHQLELAGIVEEKRIGIVAWNISGLEGALEKLENFRPAKIPKGRINEILEKFVESGMKW